MKKRWLGAALAGVMVLSLAACGGGKDETKAPDTEAAETKAAEDTVADEGTEAAGGAETAGEDKAAGGEVKKYKIAYAFANMDENNMRTLEGLQAAIEAKNATGEYEIELIYTDSQSQVDKQISDVESLIQQEPDLILMSAVDTVGSIPCLEAIQAAGIIAVDDRGCDTESKDLKWTGFDENVIGGLKAQAMKDYLEANPDVHLNVGGIYGLASQSEQLKRVQCILDLAEEMPDRITIVETQYCDWSTDRATATVEDWLQRYPEMNCIVTASDDMGLGACNALGAAGKKGWYVDAVDGTQIGMQLAEAGEQHYVTIAANQEKITQTMVDLFIDVIDGTYTEPTFSCPAECFAIVTPDTVDTVDLGRF
ncbi:MAG: sugar ABC transporter substrate-binding protein [Lachnospiraceae bacterium]|nr:sugar ABC transporter substrate-binding protein [Lachnospiraceae bacterium]